MGPIRLSYRGLWFPLVSPSKLLKHVPQTRAVFIQSLLILCGMDWVLLKVTSSSPLVRTPQATKGFGNQPDKTPPPTHTHTPPIKRAGPLLATFRKSASGGARPLAISSHRNCLARDVREKQRPPKRLSKPRKPLV